MHKQVRALVTHHFGYASMRICMRVATKMRWSMPGMDAKPLSARPHSATPWLPPTSCGARGGWCVERAVSGRVAHARCSSERAGGHSYTRPCAAARGRFGATRLLLAAGARPPLLALALWRAKAAGGAQCSAAGSRCPE